MRKHLFSFLFLLSLSLSFSPISSVTLNTTFPYNSTEDNLTAYISPYNFSQNYGYDWYKDGKNIKFVKWRKYYKITDSDEPAKLLRDSKGNLYILGKYNNATDGNSYEFIIKTDENGSMIWNLTRYINGSLVYVADAEIDENDYIYSIKRFYLPGAMYIEVTKYNENGSLVWENEINGVPYAVDDVLESYYYEANGIIYILVYGQISKLFTVDGVSHVLMISKNGTFLRGKAINNTADSESISSMDFYNGSFYIVGTISSGGFFGGTTNFSIWRLDENMTILDNVIYNESFSPSKIAINKKTGEAYVPSLTFDPFTFTFDGKLVKINMSDLSILYVKSIGGDGNPTYREAKVSCTNSIYIAGSDGSADLYGFLRRFSKEGNLLWNETINSSVDDYTTSFWLFKNGDVIALSFYNGTTQLTYYESGANIIPYNYTKENETWRVSAYTYNSTGCGNPVRSNNLTIGKPVPPLVLNVSPNNTTLPPGNITIRAKVIDNLKVDKVYVNITLPNSSSLYLQMSEVSPSLYEVSFIAQQEGTYNLSFFANDSFGMVNDSEKASFIVSTPSPPVGNDNKRFKMDIEKDFNCSSLLYSLLISGEEEFGVITIRMYEEERKSSNLVKKLYLPAYSTSSSISFVLDEGHYITEISSPGYYPETLYIVSYSCKNTSNYTENLSMNRTFNKSQNTSTNETNEIEREKDSEIINREENENKGKRGQEGSLGYKESSDSFEELSLRKEEAKENIKEEYNFDCLFLSIDLGRYFGLCWYVWLSFFTLALLLLIYYRKRINKSSSYLNIKKRKKN